MRKILFVAIVLIITLFDLSLTAQQDPLTRAAADLKKDTKEKVTFRLEERTRWEEHYGNSFGKSKNQQDMLSRLRVGMDIQLSDWLKVGALAQDARAPWYGPNAPSSLRESIDLEEAYVSLGKKGKPMSASFGRQMLNYGETRVIGVPQWSNTSRTYDFFRAAFENKHVRLEGLLVSPAIILSDSYNNPELGNRIWGTYDVVPKFWHNMSSDVYILRHSQNKIGGWTSSGTLGTNTYGMRLYGPLPLKVNYSLEAMGQNGHAGSVNQRSYAWFAGASRKFELDKMTLDSSVEYKKASGSHYGEKHNSTFDQLSPANHDKFGHIDLFGWKNLCTFKTLETLHPTKALAFNVMYTNESLFSASDSLYASSGSKIATSTHGTAGRSVGQELDAFATYSWGPHLLLAGFGHFFSGEFVTHTTPGINPRYFYIAQQYTIK